MYCERPVIAVASGGPLETVVEGETGRLCDDTPGEFAKAMAAFLLRPQDAQRMGKYSTGKWE